MTTKFLRAAALSSLLLTAGNVAMAAGGTGNSPSSPAPTREHGSSMMGMGGSMMGSCPMMSSNMGLDPKTAMRMHGEMMKAMGDIMLKYADQARTAP
ncbi:hypothetical protein AWB68_03290 [Caballeronia choica]|uniref:DUF305 domain-containing protein n=1 Tax=Caballeronia choica TaxID=326476 RepID=A0A158J245_9BURK|nr:hypothetical protein [Caballeronia choica]SAL62400.1 hypothetical protein AWB68_03290 [Caballeronia choica]